MSQPTLLRLFSPSAPPDAPDCSSMVVFFSLTLQRSVALSDARQIAHDRTFLPRSLGTTSPSSAPATKMTFDPASSPLPLAFINQSVLLFIEISPTFSPPRHLVFSVPIMLLCFSHFFFNLCWLMKGDFYHRVLLTFFFLKHPDVSRLSCTRFIPSPLVRALRDPLLHFLHVRPYLCIYLSFASLPLI